MESRAASAAVSNTRDLDSSLSLSHPLDEDGKLSSASAARSLKYAKAHDLPSFPSAGLQMSSAGAAASLAESNKKSFEHWKPGEIPAANKAALLAKDYEMDPLWQPEMSAAGSRAAILAHRDGAKTESTKEMKSLETGSLPTKALSNKSANTNTGSEVPSDSHRKALLAAAGAMSGSRRRAGSAPIQPKDDRSWAMKAATASHNSGGASPPLRPFASGDPGFEAARIQNVARSNVSRQMYSSTPPVAIEVEEKNRQAMLKASAVAMAQKMYAIQQQHIDDAAGVKKTDGHLAAVKARGRTMSTGSSSIGDTTAPTPRYENLEEAARRLAQEKLAKLHDEHAEYRSYYGQTTSPRARLSNRLRRRASSGTKSEDSDEEQSRRIRSQMSIFQSKLAEVDSKKRQADRDALLEVAHSNVDARMRKMDDKVFQETGKASPAQMEKWEKAAREKAQRESDERMQNVGKVHIGGGKYLDQSEVDAIAKARLQPTLDDINDKAEKQRARDEEIRLEQERVKSQADREKAREAEVKAEVKAANDREKEEQRQRKAEEKRLSREQAAAEKERARLEKEEKRKSKEHKGGRFSSMLGRSGGATVTGAAAGGTVGAADAAVQETGTTATHEQVAESSPNNDDIARDINEKPENDGSASEESSVVEAHYIASSPTRQESKVKSWLKKPLFRSGNKGRKEEDEEKGEEVEASGVTTEDNRVSSDQDGPKSDSIRDVALAGRTSTRETEDMYRADEPVSPIKDTSATNRGSRSPSISSLSDSAKEEEHKVDPAPATASTDSAAVENEEGRGRKAGFRRRLIKKMKPGKDKGKEPETQAEVKDDKERKNNLGPTSSNTDEEAFEEARDTFQEEKLAPPPPLSSLTAGNAGGRGGSPRGSHERSRFTENL